MGKINDHDLRLYRELFAAGEISFLEIRTRTGVSRSRLEQLLLGHSRVGRIEAGGPLAESLTGVKVMFDDESERERSRKKIYQRRYTERKRAERLDWAKKHLGGRCVECGSVDDLEFDHIDAATKSFHIAQQPLNSWARFRAEVAKCQLLCYGCHKLKSAEEAREYNAWAFAGERGPRAKLTNRQVRDIRERFARREFTITELSKKLGMARRVVSAMLQGMTYVHAGGPLARPEEAINHIPDGLRSFYRRQVADLYRSGVTSLAEICKRVPISSHTAKSYLQAEGLLGEGPVCTPQPATKLTDEQVLDYRERVDAGELTITQMAHEVGMSVAGASRVVRGISYRHVGGPLKRSL